MNKRIDLTGVRFGKLVAETIGKSIRANKKSKVYTTWLCKCDCGNKVVVRTAKLRSGEVTSCGCDYCGNSLKIGDKVGKLTAGKYIGNSEWVLYCECGEATICRTDNVISGHIKSCGCIRKKDI